VRFAIVLVAVTSTAFAAPFVPERAVVVGRVDDRPWSDAPTEARLDQKAELAAIVIGKRAGKRVVLAPEGITSVRIARAKVRTEKLESARVRWSAVEPHGFRKSPAKNGVGSTWYSNVSQEPTTFGTWMGYDTIDYFERELVAWTTNAILPATISAGEDHAQQVPGLGTLRFKVEVELAGPRGPITVASPGKEAVDSFGILPSVHRVSIRRGDDFLGYLSSYLLVPEVFGSAGGGRDHQTERFTGADCADVMVGAIRRAGKRLAYTNVAGLPAYTKRISGSIVLDENGSPSAPIGGVRPGDLIRIDYGGAFAGHSPRAWDHVAALWEDKSDPTGPHRGGPDGQLDGFDLVIHMGHPRLKIEPMSEQSPATVDVLRWR
jgi:hypothetical protein